MEGGTRLSHTDHDQGALGKDRAAPEVVYVKDNVSVHPSPSARQRISGRLRLIKQADSLFLTWIPYTNSGLIEDRPLHSGGSAAGLAPRPLSRSEKDRNLYTIRAVSVSEIRSIRRHTPTLGWNYIIIVLTTGLAFPPLYFHNGGVRGFLAVLKEHARLVRSSEDSNVYLVNDTRDPLQRSLNSLDLVEAITPSMHNSPMPSAHPSPPSTPLPLGPAPPPGNRDTEPRTQPASPSGSVGVPGTSPDTPAGSMDAPAGPAPAGPVAGPTGGGGQGGQSYAGTMPGGGAETDGKVNGVDSPQHPPSDSSQRLSPSASPWRPGRPPSPQPGDVLRDASIQILEKFSLVTKLARDASAQLFGNGGESVRAEMLIGLPPPRLVPKRAAGKQEGEEGGGVYAEDLRSWGWDGVISEQERGKSPQAGVADGESNRPKPSQLEASTLGVFELVDGTQGEESPALVWGSHRFPALGAEEWATFSDSEGRINNAKALTTRIFQGGIEPGMRAEIWKFLLGYLPYDSTHAEREMLQEMKRCEYYVLKQQWQTISEAQVRRFSKFRERRQRIDKDVVRTDRALQFFAGDDNDNVAMLRDILITYAFYNFDLGYCQGMSDLLSPILYVMGNELDAFWCFAALMERMAGNFHRDQAGMHNQLLALSKLVQLLDPSLHDYLRQQDCLNFFFCFRWVLIIFKREFEFGDVLRLWEVLWSRHLTDHFHLYVCVAILKRHRRKIMDEQMSFDTLLKFINDLSGHIDLESTLRDAEALCRYAGEAGEQCMPPAPPLTDEVVVAREAVYAGSGSFKLQE